MALGIFFFQDNRQSTFIENVEQNRGLPGVFTTRALHVTLADLISFPNRLTCSSLVSFLLCLILNYTQLTYDNRQSVPSRGSSD